MTTLERQKSDIDKIPDPFQGISTAAEVASIIDSHILPTTIEDSKTKKIRAITEKERVKLYRRLAMKYHPDRAPEHKKQLHNDIFSRINITNDKIEKSSKNVQKDNDKKKDTSNTPNTSNNHGFPETLESILNELIRKYQNSTSIQQILFIHQDIARIDSEMINNKEYSQERMIRHIVPHFLKAYVDFSSNSRESIKLIREEFLEISGEIKRIEERYNISLSSESSIFINHYSQKLERELTGALGVFGGKGNKYKTIISIYEKIEANHNINLSEQKNRLLSIMNEERVNKVTPVAEYPNQKKSNSNGTEFYGISQASDEELEKFLEENSGIGLSVMGLKDVIKKGYPMTNNLENIFTEFLMKNK